MLVYPHWLDGEYRLLWLSSTQNARVSPDAQAERLMKLYALLGIGFSLSDSNLVDGPVLWRQFSNQGFQLFVSSHRDFLRLVSRPFGDSPATRFNVVAGGLHRALKAGMIASPMKDPRAILSLAERIVSDGEGIDLDRLATSIEERPGDEDLQLSVGFVEAVRYFLSPDSRAAAPSSDRGHDTYYDVLARAPKSKYMTGAEVQAIEDALMRIDRAVEDPSERIRRMSVRRALLADPDPVAGRAAWTLVVEAWNCAAQNTVCPGAGLVAKLPNALPLGIHIFEPEDVVLTSPVSKSGYGRALREKLTVRLQADPGLLSWEEVRRVVEAKRTSESRAAFREALRVGNREAADAALRELGRSIAADMSGRIEPHGADSWLWSVGGVVFELGGIPGAGKLAGMALLEGASFGLINKYRSRLIASRIVQAGHPLVGSS